MILSWVNCYINTDYRSYGFRDSPKTFMFWKLSLPIRFLLHINADIYCRKTLCIMVIKIGFYIVVMLIIIVGRS